MMDPSRVTTLYGVDGVRSGWVVARATLDLDLIDHHVVDDLQALAGGAGRRAAGDRHSEQGAGRSAFMSRIYE